MPLIRRIPKRGFTHVKAVRTSLVNLKELNRFAEGAVVDPEALAQAKLIRSPERLVKILGEGILARKLTVKAHRFSKSAQEKIRSAGGAVELLKRWPSRTSDRGSPQPAEGNLRPGGPLANA